MPCTGRDRGPRQQGAVTEDGRPPSSPLKSLGVGVSGGEGAGWEEARNRPWQAEWDTDRELNRLAEQLQPVNHRVFSSLTKDTREHGLHVQTVPGQAHLGPGPLPVTASSEALEGSGGVLLARRQCQLLRGLWSVAGFPRGLAGSAGSLGSWRLRGSPPLRRLQRAPCWAWASAPGGTIDLAAAGGRWWAPPAGRSQSPQEARGAERGLPARVGKLHLPRGLRRRIRPPGSP